MSNEYTVEKHVKNLLALLEVEYPCAYCPSTTLYNYEPLISLKTKCKMCREFIGIDYYTDRCPCHELGREEAIKRTWLALEKEGYL